MSREPETVAERLREGTIRWSALSLDGIEAGYRRVIAPRLAADGRDPRATVPSRSWLRERGHGSLEYALREHHDTTLSRFCRERLGVDDGDDRPSWPTDHGPTRERLDDWYWTQRDRRQDVTSEATVRAKAARLRTYVRLYREENGTGDLLGVVAGDDRAAAYDAVTAAYDRLNERLSTARSKYQYHVAVREFYRSCVDSGRAAFDPVEGLMDTYGWDAGGDAETPALDADAVGTLHAAAADDGERLLVVALAAWGLRRGEVAALHRRQFRLDPDEGGPRIGFESRKNGPGTVALVHGRDALDDRLDALDGRWTDHTDGYLFPSRAAADGHAAPSTVADRFGRLVDRAGVELPDGGRPTPKHCRRFWYERYSTVMGRVDEWLGAAADEQGSASVDVLRRNYVPDRRLAELRRERMAAELADAFASGDRQ